MPDFFWCFNCGELTEGTRRDHRCKSSQQAKERAIAAAEAHANEQWRETAFVCVWRVARGRRFLTTDHVWLELIEQPVATHEPRAIGAIMQRAMREGMVKPTFSYWPSKRARCHGRPVRVWESLVYKQEKTA